MTKGIAVCNAFRELGITATLQTCDVPSGVRDQPIGLKEMQLGAENRAERAMGQRPEADFAVGVESGLVEVTERWFDVPYIVVLTKRGWKSCTVGAYFPVPRWMVERALERGTEIGKIVQELTGGDDKDVQKCLSDGKISRVDIITAALKYALAPIAFSYIYKD
ncbi:DUF84 family protein [Candidatus Kaiserbacteria bacterium]|nr:DUF84 family protein [Candidatus Kaiserbacteria bacterium]